MALGGPLRLEVANDAVGVAEALDRLGEYLEGAGCGPDLTSRAMLVADELISNVARCAFPEGERHLFSMAAVPELVDGETHVRMTVEDGGLPFDPTLAPEPDIGLPLEERDVGGLGIHLVRGMSRDLSYARVTGLNRTIVLVDGRDR